MNTISTPDAGPTALPLRPVRRPSAWVNLVRKECKESREALIAGLVIFWVLPVLLELFWFGLDRNHETFPLASGLLIGAGWLYAIIVGAHTVCRDWGKPEERFLLAQPVSPRAVVAAKLVIGAALIAGIVALVLVWDMMLAHWGVFGADYKNASLMMGLVICVAVCIMAVGYSLAFATAVLTRQMLASTVVAALALLVWAIAPLLSSHLARFGALAVFENWSHAMIKPFIFVSVLGLIACVATSFFCSTLERVIRLGNKQLAWTIGLVMLTLLGVATTEIGNSPRVRDQVELLDFTANDNSRGMRLFQRGNRFFAIADGGPTHTQMWRIATFRVADNGRIQDLRRALVPGMMSQPLPNGEQPRDELTGFSFDKGDHLVMSWKRMRAVRIHESYNRYSYNRDYLENLWRTTLTWPDGSEPKVVSRVELALPPGQRLDKVGSSYWNNTNSSQYAYIVSEVGEDRSVHEDKLYVFDWSDGPNPGPRFEIPLPEDTTSVGIWEGKLRIRVKQGGSQKEEDRRVATFDAEHPETLLDKQNWSFRIPPYEKDWVRQFDRSGNWSTSMEQHGDFAYLSDLLGLRIAKQTQAGRWEIIGECRTSPLAMLFRSDAFPQIIDDSLLIEYTGKGIIAYDVSNPSKPRRVGFFNAAPWEIFATKHNLVLCEFNLITVFDRPDQRGKNNP